MLTAPYPQYSQNILSQLGRILLKEKPEIAKALISEYLPHRAPLETDLTKIPLYFQSFCQLQNINPKEYTGALYKSSKIDKRRLFVAVIILLYHPRTRLVAKYISETIKQDAGLTTRMIREIEFRYKKMEDFKTKVDEIVNVLIKNNVN